MVERILVADDTLQIRTCLAQGFWERLFGLVRSSEYTCMMFDQCRSVHTFGMASKIDLAFLNKDLVVVKVLKALPPGKICFAKNSMCVVERISSYEPWFEVGQKIDVVEGS